MGIVFSFRNRYHSAIHMDNNSILNCTVHTNFITGNEYEESLLKKEQF